MIPVLAFVLSSIFVYFSYTHTQNYLKHSTLRFSELPENKQFYVVKNIIKGVYLAILVVLGGVLLLPGVFRNEFDNFTIRILASMYVSNDFVGLYKVSNLPTSTRVHHSATIILLIAAWTIDFQESNVGQLLLMYTYLSTISFPVNLYLGLRMCYEIDWLKQVSKYVYLFSCLLNWYLQYKWHEVNTYFYIYISILMLIVIDDVILLRWLWK